MEQFNDLKCFNCFGISSIYRTVYIPEFLNRCNNKNVRCIDTNCDKLFEGDPSLVTKMY